MRAAAAAPAAGTIEIRHCTTDGAFVVRATFRGGGEAIAPTIDHAERIALSARRWWRRHQDQYLRDVTAGLNPRGWTPPRVPRVVLVREVEPGRLSRLTEAWRDHLLTNHRRQVAIAPVRGGAS